MPAKDGSPHPLLSAVPGAAQGLAAGSAVASSCKEASCYWAWLLGQTFLALLPSRLAGVCAARIHRLLGVGPLALRMCLTFGP